MPLRTSWPRVVGVELGDRRHDALDEPAGGRLLEPFRDRDQADAQLLHPGLDGGVVSEVPGQPVDLVDHEMGDVPVLVEHGHHRLEGRAVVCPAGLAQLGELVLDDPALVASKAAAGFELSFDRVAAFGLLAGGNADVYNGLLYVLAALDWHQAASRRS